jgi:Zn-dependent peptidase ImmA (M78 family)
MIDEGIEIEAERVLSKCGVTELPVPIEYVADCLGLRVRRAPSTEFSGLLLRRDGTAMVGVNSNEAPVRQRFTIAHEIGHFVMHPQKDAFVDFRKNFRPNGPADLRERQANMFAAAVLMPRKMLLQEIERLTPGLDVQGAISKLARRYGVSVEAMRYRLINLGIHKAVG